MERRAQVALRIAVGVVVGGVSLWVAIRKVDLGEVGHALATFDLRYLVAAVAVSAGIQLLRAWRWQIELSPLARLRYALMWQVVSVAYMMINVLPFRLGEPVRPVLLSWKSGLPIPAILGNWVFEKTMDAAALVLFIHVTLLITDLPAWAWEASAFSLVMFISLLVLIVGFWLRGEAVFDRTLGRILPDKGCTWMLGMLRSAREGLRILPDRRLVAIVFVVTMVLWGLPILSSYLLILGFGFDIPASAAFVVFVAIGLGTTLPNPPGMVGIFQVASVVALGLFGVDKADALAYGILLNALQLLTLVAQGCIALPFLDVRLGRLTKAAVTSTERPCD